MPNKGWKSITIREEVFNELQDIWQNNMVNYRKRGITSFSGLCTKLLYSQIESENVINDGKGI